ncbi:MAG: choice-of-anchor Q domain-containing protein [Candidatus Cloacimonadota bacterium]|nr:choice-of-anchor Q domain-containing protein [Candidatus Cloacimonadota bacterium]
MQQQKIFILLILFLFTSLSLQSKSIRTEKGRESFESKSNEKDVESKKKNNRETIIVDIEGTGNYTSIQEGIDAAADGDLVLVYPGTYYENINYNGKNISVASKYYTTGDESYIDSTIIDGNQNNSCVIVNSGETNAEIIGFTVQHGSGLGSIYGYYGGGLYIDGASFSIKFCSILNNISSVGGGISSNECPQLYIEGTYIINNMASTAGGGLAKGNDDVFIDFSEINKCNIYNNYSPIGSDIYNHNGDMYVLLDTFTVQEPNKFYVYSREDEITMEVENHKIETINQDLYVSPEGNNNNSGLSPDDPLQNIYNALIKIKSDSTHPNTIHLAEGFYSPSNTGEFFALGGKEYISIIGAGKEETIIDAEQTGRLVTIIEKNNVIIKNLTLQHGLQLNTGGLSVDGSNVIIKNVILKDNISSDEYSESHINTYNYCNPIFENVNILTTYEQVNGRATRASLGSNPLYLNCRIEGNHTNPEIGNFGAGSCVNNSCPTFINTLIADNSADICSGIAQLWSYEDMYFINCTIVNNGNCSEGTIRLVEDSHVTLINTILRNDPYTEIYFCPTGPPNSARIKYCNIENGINAINTNNNGTINWGDGNIDEDPMFVGGDPFSYELTEDSPCIDAGTPDTTGLNLPQLDLAGNGRIYNGRVDIGAYEWHEHGISNPDTSFIYKLYLFKNQPNPFKDETEILFITTDYERVEDYQLSIYNVRGQLVKKYNGKKDDFWAKTKIVWDGKDRNGNEVSPGTYFYKLEYGKNAVVRKMVKVGD